MKKILLLIIFMAVLAACNFSKSVKKDFSTGLVTLGDGLECENVYMSVNDEQVNQTTFIYGTKFSMNFEDIRGFEKEGENAFPGMRLLVTSAEGDTIMKTGDLYESYSGGLSFSPLLLTASFTAAAPVRSGGVYFMTVNIWDKKSNGKFSGRIGFDIKPNDQIVVESGNVKYREAYLFSEERNAVITGNRVRAAETTHIIIEGIEGFAEADGLVFPGLSLRLTDQENNFLINEEDLFAGYGKDGLKAQDLHSRVSANFNLAGVDIKNPLRLTMVIIDRKSEAMVTVSAYLTAE